MTESKPKMRNISTYTLRKASEHIYYETWMFFETINQLKHPQDQCSVNILLDDFAIHCRNLLDFLYPKNQIRNDDMTVFDYISDSNYYRKNKTPKSELKFIIKKADKQVAHLTYARNRYSKSSKPWPFVLIGKGFYKTLTAFYDSLPENRKKWSFFMQLKQVLDSIS